jgi:predicted MFS family arabinose efflux permease
LGAGLVSSLADAQGFKAAFAIVAAINICTLAVWPWMDYKHKKHETEQIWSV